MYCFVKIKGSCTLLHSLPSCYQGHQSQPLPSYFTQLLCDPCLVSQGVPLDSPCLQWTVWVIFYFYCSNFTVCYFIYSSKKVWLNCLLVYNLSDPPSDFFLVLSTCRLQQLTWWVQHYHNRNNPLTWTSCFVWLHSHLSRQTHTQRLMYLRVRLLE